MSTIADSQAIFRTWSSLRAAISSSRLPTIWAGSATRTAVQRQCLCPQVGRQAPAQQFVTLTTLCPQNQVLQGHIVNNYGKIYASHEQPNWKKLRSSGGA